MYSQIAQKTLGIVRESLQVILSFVTFSFTSSLEISKFPIGRSYSREDPLQLWWIFNKLIGYLLAIAR